MAIEGILNHERTCLVESAIAVLNAASGHGTAKLSAAIQTFYQGLYPSMAKGCRKDNRAHCAVCSKCEVTYN